MKIRLLPSAFFLPSDVEEKNQALLIGMDTSYLLPSQSPGPLN